MNTMQEIQEVQDLGQREWGYVGKVIYSDGTYKIYEFPTIEEFVEFKRENTPEV